MTTTLENMIDEVLLNLQGYTLQQAQSTYITTPVTTTTSPSTSPTVLQLASTDSLGKGIIEIDEELLWVDNYDRVSNTATVAPYGRGFLGTTAATHLADSRVMIAPIFPRSVVKRAINDTLRAMGTQIVGVYSTSFTYTLPQTTYGFNDLTIKNIFSIMWQTVGPSKEWVYIRNWDWDSKADTGVWGSGAQTVTIGDYVTPGRTVKVIYGKDPQPFTSNSQDFATQTGLPESCKDVVIYGACYRLLSFMDPARASMVSPQADETDSRRPYGSSNQAVKQLYALYTQRLQDEVLEQQRNYPIRAHYARR